MRVPTANCPSAFTTGAFWTAPTASAAACGSVIMALNSSTSNMPRLLIVKVAPVMSSGFIRPSRARATSSRASRANCANGFLSQSRSTAVTRPLSRATARPTFTCSCT